MITPIQLTTFIVIIIGLLLLGIGIVLFFLQHARIARYLHAEGVVIELLNQRAQGEYIRTNTDNGVKLEKKYLYRPAIQFKPIKGRAVRFTASVSSRPVPYKVGDTVDIIYDPDSPQHAQINRFLHLWFYVLLFVFLGIFVLGMGLVGYLIS